MAGKKQNAPMPQIQCDYWQPRQKYGLTKTRYDTLLRKGLIYMKTREEVDRESKLFLQEMINRLNEENIGNMGKPQTYEKGCV